MRRLSKVERFPVWKVAAVVDHSFVDNRACLRLQAATGGETYPHANDTVRVAREVRAYDAYEAQASVRLDIEAAGFDVVTCWIV